MKWKQGMMRIETTKGSRRRRSTLPSAPARLAGLAAIALASLLMVSGLAPSHADDPTSEVQDLQVVLAKMAPGAVRLALDDGSIAVGRIVKIDGETITIRRPSGGLRHLPVAEITGLNLKAKGGALRPGRIILLENGGVGWQSTQEPDPTEVAANNERSDMADIGVPFVVEDMDNPDASGGPTLIRAEPAAVDASPTSFEELAAAAPIPLQVTADQGGEAGGLITFRLTLSSPAPRSILIIYTTIDGSASAPGDYAHRQGTITFQPGETEVSVTTDIIDDGVAEGPESIQFFITGDPATVRIEERKITAIVEDNDDGA